MSILRIIVVTIFTIVSMLEISADIYTIVWKVYDRKKTMLRMPVSSCDFQTFSLRALWGKARVLG